MDGYITTFRGDYNFLSNFHSCVIHYNGHTYNSVETAFQAQKCPSAVDKFRNMGVQEALKAGRRPIVEPGEAKRLGRKLPLRPDWEDVKERLMLELLTNKFTQNDELRRKLLETGSAVLVESNTWHDNYWGACTCPRCSLSVRNNKLGFLLMEIREALLHDRNPLEVIELG